MKNIAIAGAGGLGREVLVLLHQINEVHAIWNITGFYDDNSTLRGSFINGLPWLGTIADLAATDSPLHLVIGIGNPQVKKQIIAALQVNKSISFPTLLHPSVQIKPYQYITTGNGVILTQGVVLTTNIRIGHHVLINLNCTIGHGTVVGDYASIMPGVHLSGETFLGAGTYIGTNAVVLPGLHIGDDSQIGAGAVVTTSIPAKCTAAGVPAKIIRQHEL
ncbi:acetyltransferase [Pontibacter sp. 172403-2]|uniref:acetyltransferase n=1 Tax=Pontibacter rufus TaxID=2791028 RepID=UPI0018AFFD43|nr:acetyltransferase [Pontibacter sp. 172403-2]MBF9252392.1 acetyltransferase [Pontibacter sp. 172403-2]